MMVLEAWAKEFWEGGAVAPDLRRHVDLHMADIAVAFFAGCGSAEAQALARFHAGSVPSKASPDTQAAAVAAVIRRTECDDIDVVSCITPGSIVVPTALAFASHHDDISRFDRAVAAGYAAGLRIGSALGGAEALSTGIWPTYFAAPMMAAATASVALGLDEKGITSAIAIAAAGAGGRLGRIPGQPSGRWLVLGEAVGKGCRAALAAASGFQGDPELISAEWLAAIANPDLIKPAELTKRIGIEAVGLKPFVAARQIINAIVAFLAILQRGVSAHAIERIEIGVPTIHAAIVAKPANADDRLSSIANMHVQIAAAALRPDLLYDIDRRGEPADDLVAFGQRVTIAADPTLDVHLPFIWPARVKVVAEGREFEEICTEIPGDPTRNDGAGVVSEKLSRMVPTRYRDLCSSILGGGEPSVSRHAVLWQTMLGALQ